MLPYADERISGTLKLGGAAGETNVDVPSRRAWTTLDMNGIRTGRGDFSVKIDGENGRLLGSCVNRARPPLWPFMGITVGLTTPKRSAPRRKSSAAYLSSIFVGVLYRTLPPCDLALTAYGVVDGQDKGGQAVLDVRRRDGVLLAWL